MFVYNHFFNVLSLLKMSMLEELSDSLQQIDLGIYLMIEGWWLEEVC